MASKSTPYKWQFQARFRKNAFGWKSQPAITRVKEAVSEIKKVARKDPTLAAEGAVLILEKVSPALAHVDSSSGAIGTAVNDAVCVLAGIIAGAPADTKTREAWLERLFDAHAHDDIPYIETLADYWGDMCGSPESASKWADQLIDITRRVLNLPKGQYEYFHGTTACLSALYTAERYDELIDILEAARFWPYRRWAVKALIAQGKKAEAVRYAEACRDPWANNHDIDTLCEDVLLSLGLADDAYRKYGLTANRASTHLAWFRAVAKKYPDKTPSEILADLVSISPGEEGKWFAAAKSEALFDEAVILANQSPCSPQTLTRAARDFVEKCPLFALESGMAALRWLADGYGYDITAADVLNAFSFTMKAAVNAECEAAARARIRAIVDNESSGKQFLTKVLGRELGLS